MFTLDSLARDYIFLTTPVGSGLALVRNVHRKAHCNENRGHKSTLCFLFQEKMNQFLYSKM